jgi:cellulose synthase/poly-beta-1,6-N-acetylglucosamine synthase-like glycosyltransferase
MGNVSFASWAHAAQAVVLTDAETLFAPGCLAAMAEALRDPRVDCVTGRLEWRDEGATATSTQEGLYWRYERRVRELESRAGLLTAVTGALLAVRATAYRAVPPTSMDHLLPLYVREAAAWRLCPRRRRHGSADQRASRALRNRTRTATRGIGRTCPWSGFGAGDDQVRRGRSGRNALRWATPWFVLVVAGRCSARRPARVPRGADRGRCAALLPERPTC